MIREDADQMMGLGPGGNKAAAYAEGAHQQSAGGEGGSSGGGRGRGGGGGRGGRGGGRGGGGGRGSFAHKDKNKAAIANHHRKDRAMKKTGI